MRSIDQGYCSRELGWRLLLQVTEVLSILNNCIKKKIKICIFFVLYAIQSSRIFSTGQTGFSVVNFV